MNGRLDRFRDDAASEFQFRPRALAMAGLGLLIASAALILSLGSLQRASRPASPAGAAIERLIAQAAHNLDVQAPFAAAGATAVDISARGNRLLYRMTLPDDIPATETEAMRARLEAANAAELCAGADTRRMIEMGGVFEHRYADPSGDGFRTEVASCSGWGSAARSPLPMAM